MILFVCAAPSEREGVAQRVLELGVGKVAAATALSRALATELPQLVLLFGVCGAYPREHGGAGPELRVGDLCLVGDDRLGDEGRLDPAGFASLAEMGLGEVGPWAADPERTHAAERILAVPVVGAATVSTGSGVDARSRELAARTGARIETMEGAAVAQVCAHFSVPWVALRAVSNPTGDDYRAHMDLARALAALRGALAELRKAGWT